MSSMFSQPAVAPMPVDPSVSEEAEKQRQAAAQAAHIAAISGGRRSTIVGGTKIAYERRARRNASASLGV